MTATATPSRRSDLSGRPDFHRESFTLGAGKAITLAAPVSRLRVRAGEVEVSADGVLARVPAGRTYEPSGAISQGARARPR